MDAIACMNIARNSLGEGGNSIVNLSSLFVLVICPSYLFAAHRSFLSVGRLAVGVHSLDQIFLGNAIGLNLLGGGANGFGILGLG